MFRVGQKVVCVDVSPSGWGRPCELVKGDIYTIAGLDNCPDLAGETGVHLCEIASPEETFHRAGFRASRFRPIVDRPTDISVFKEMLHPSKIAEACDV